MKRLLAALLVLASASCDKLYWCAVAPGSTPDNIVFLFGDRSDLSGTAPVNGFSIDGRPIACEPDTMDPWRQFWACAPETGTRDLPLDSVRYGETPTGMVTTVPADTLRTGWVYDIHPGYQGLGTDAWFTVEEGVGGSRILRILTEDEYHSIVGGGG